MPTPPATAPGQVRWNGWVDKELRRELLARAEAGMGPFAGYVARIRGERAEKE